MKSRDQLRMHSVLLALSLALGLPAASAGEPQSTIGTIGTSENAESKLSSEFAGFLGGTEQAHVVVDGLRQSTAFTYTQPDTPDAVIDPPTGTMGYGNVRIALRLAQAELNELGIAQPTPDELAAILLGGEIDGAPVDGILALRADGMGWGQIAQHYGMTVGQLMGKGAGLTKQPSTLPSTGGKTARGSTGKTTHSSQVRANGYIPSGNGKALGYGIVSGTGESVSAIEPNGGKQPAHKPSADTHGNGTVSAAGGGQHTALAGTSNAAGGPKALAPGLARKN
jgi:hypothetical protein